MDELQRLAKAYYRAGSPELKNEAKELFNSLDRDGDGRVEKNEFLSFMTKHGYRSMNTQRFFNELDNDGNRTLDFWEVMTLLYIFKSRRPFCDGCGRFIPATYFTCTQCPDYDLCISCYENGKSGHNHRFMDNYALLAVKKRSELEPAPKYSKREAALEAFKIGVEIGIIVASCKRRGRAVLPTIRSRNL